MKHLILSRELPPSPGGGIGTYVQHLSRLLAENGEQVHVIGVLWKGAERAVEELHGGRLVVHRVPLRDWRKESSLHPSIDPRLEIDPRLVASLFHSGFQPLAFAFQAALLAEKLVEEEGIDLIEAQEFEAPLYFFQLRRALGLGPRRRPPCLVHLHSPMELIVRHNDLDIYAPYFQIAKRCEDYSIRAADALLCPSGFLTRQAEEHYGLAPGSIETIPLPLGTTTPIEREPETWREGTICYAGRLELRKGILEWIDAAVRVAREEPGARFELIGGETRGVTVASLLDRIPPPLRPRFLFRGERTRSEVRKFLSRARMAVVPSRWENFPYACLEAMASGLPVLATACGGMAEMVRDGESGWIAESCRPEELASALVRALRTPWEELSRMGRVARESIHRLCDPAKILERQLALRRRVVKGGAGRSLELPRLPDAPPERPGPASRGAGIAIVVTPEQPGSSLRRCLDSIERQSAPPVAVEVAPVPSPEAIGSNGRTSAAAARNAAIERILGSGANPAGFLFLRSTEIIAPGLLSTCEPILEKRPELGILSFWCWQPHGKRAWLRLNPSFPYQWLSNEAAPMCVIRTEALLAAGKFRLDAAPGYEGWDLVNAVLVSGYRAVTMPDALATAGEILPHLPAVPLDHEGRRARKEILSRFPDLAGTEAHELVSLAQSMAASVKDRQFAIWRAERGLSGASRKMRGRLGWVKQNLKRLLDRTARSQRADEPEDSPQPALRRERSLD